VAVANARQLLQDADVSFAPSALEAADGAEALVIVTGWPEFRTVDLTALRDRMAHPIVVDGRNLFDPDAMRTAGFTYRGVGRGR
jgi:UDPglucose 6-dehydrogenase